MQPLSIALRPRSLSEISGQAGVIRELTKTYQKKGGFSQAILLKGPSGVGKTSVAQIIAMMLNCAHPKPDGSPCGECASCKAIIEERFDLNTQMLDGGSSSKGEVIDFAEMASIAPMYEKNNVFIIEEADQLSTAAKNSLLKVLEKPYKNTYFILLSMVFNGLSPALQSRCQVYTFRTFGVSDIMMALRDSLIKIGLWEKEGIPASFYVDVLPTIAEASMGSLRTAVQLLEKCLDAEYYTIEEVQSNIGILSPAFSYDVLTNLLMIKKDFFLQIKDLDFQDFFNLSYYRLAQAAQYRITKEADNEFYEEQLKALAGEPNLLEVLSLFDSIYAESNGYPKKTQTVSKIAQYYLNKKRRIVEDA